MCAFAFLSSCKQIFSSVKPELLEIFFQGENIAKTLLSSVQENVLFCVRHLFVWLYLKKQQRIIGATKNSASLNFLACFYMYQHKCTSALRWGQEASGGTTETAFVKLLNYIVSPHLTPKGNISISCFGVHLTSPDNLHTWLHVDKRMWKYQHCVQRP